MRTACVYRAYDAAGRLLYIGSTVDLDARVKAHETGAAWWFFQVRIDTEEHPSADAAREAEARAIATEHPRWNVEHRSPDHPDGYATTASQMPWLREERDIARSIRALKANKNGLRQKWRTVSFQLAAQESLARSVSEGSLDFTLEDIS